MKRIQKFSSYLLVLVTCGIFALPLIEGLKWFGALPDWAWSDWGVVKTPEGIVDLSTLSMTFVSKSVCVIGDVIGFLSFFMGMVVVRKILKKYSAGEIFNSHNARLCTYVGILFLIDGILALPLSETCMVLGATLASPSGHRYVTLAIGTYSVEEVISGCVIIVMSWVMKEAAILQEEHQLTV